LQRQIIDHHADVGAAAVEPDRLESQRMRGGVQPGRQALRGRFLITGGAVDLPSQKQAGNCLMVQRRTKLARVGILVFDRITRPDDPGALRPSMVLRKACWTSAGNEVLMPFG
jgi:hypothetical protein